MPYFGIFVFLSFNYGLLVITTLTVSLSRINLMYVVLYKKGYNKSCEPTEASMAILATNSTDSISRCFRSFTLKVSHAIRLDQRANRATYGIS